MLVFKLEFYLGGNLSLRFITELVAAVWRI